jgi:hypothetical protein
MEKLCFARGNIGFSGFMAKIVKEANGKESRLSSLSNSINEI